jgi:hypothetical protein
VLTCDPNKKHGDRTIGAYIDTSCFAPAPKGSIGNDSGINTVRGPGLNNWDMSIFKKFYYGEKQPLHPDSRGSLQRFQPHELDNSEHRGPIQPGQPAR